MKYHAPTKQLTFRVDDVERASFFFLYAIKNIRVSSKRPLTPYELKTCLRPDDLAMKAIIDAAEALGIDLGAKWGNEIDVSGIG